MLHSFEVTKAKDSDLATNDKEGTEVDIDQIKM